ncbi:MAG: sulfatase [Phycisphaeraceae bacterium]
MQRPNIILGMTDDQGWGDVGFNGHDVLQTPHLDRLAAHGARFNRFYAAAPVCSPTRGSAITGRHPYRYGIFFANVGHMPPEEVTLAQVLREQGYRTGHFGKWHLGTLTTEMIDGRRGGRENEHYAPPWDHGFDTCFSTEVAVPTWNPCEDQPIPGKYWTGPGRWATDNLEGDDSRVIMDRAIPFMREAVESSDPFFAIVWFHAPHTPVRAGEAHRRAYADQSEDHQHYYGCLSGMDEQMGRLRDELETLGVADNTILCFCSDNGPAGEGGGTAQHPGGRQQGSPGPFRGRKGSLYEGGVRVPGLMLWPGVTRPGQVIDTACCTSDYFPTLVEALGFRLRGQPEPIDGESIMPILRGERSHRQQPIGFESQQQLAFMDNRYKLYSSDAGQTFALFDLVEDPAETRDVAGEHPERVTEMTQQLARWRASCRESLAGRDYQAGRKPWNR